MELKDVTVDVQPYSAVAQVERNAFTRRLMEYGGIGAITAVRNYTLYNPDSHLTGYYRSLKAVATQETETRHEGNPEPTPAGNDSLEQPHASPYEKQDIIHT
jgi:hypothetical protein